MENEENHAFSAVEVNTLSKRFLTLRRSVAESILRASAPSSLCPLSFIRLAKSDGWNSVRSAVMWSDVHTTHCSSIQFMNIEHAPLLVTGSSVANGRNEANLISRALHHLQHWLMDMVHRLGTLGRLDHLLQH